MWWDEGKHLLKKLIQRYSSRHSAVARRARISSLENTLYHLTRRENDGEDVSRLIKETKDLLDLEHLHSSQGVKIRVREQWAEEGETSSYFFRLEKSRALRRLFTGIRNAEGVVAYSISAIIRVWCLIYVQLFTAASLCHSEKDFFVNTLDRKLSDRHSALCEGEVTLAECRVARDSFKNNKTPGIDRLSYEFYKHFWDLFGSDLVAVFYASLSSGTHSYTQRTGLITLLY